jgi:signal transduction histidine kinase
MRVLVIDDDELDRMAVRRALMSVAPHVSIIEARDVAQGASAVAVGRFDCVLLDFHLPDGNGLEMLVRMREAGDSTPVIMLTGVADAQTAAELMKSGATDYVSKALLSAERLERSLRYALRIRAAEEQVRRYKQQLEALSAAAPRINATLSAETTLATTADEARKVVGARYARTRMQRELEPLGWIEATSREGDDTADQALDDAIEASLFSRDGSVVGTLEVRGKVDGTFTDSDHAMVTQLAQLASVGIENARLFETARAATRARDDVLAIVSHDLRNPVHTIIMASTLQLEMPPPGDRRRSTRQQSEIVLRAANRANRLIDDLFDATRIESGTFSINQQAVPITQIVSDAIDLLTPSAVAAHVQLVAEVEEQLPPAFADAQRVLQVFSNLGGNAIKFTPEGGRVTIAVRIAGTELQLSVSDSGVGIKREDVTHVFDRYWQGRERAHLGAGLGLWIAKSIVQAHGGRISIESKPDAGTTVTFTLPCSPAYRATS